MNVPGKDEPWIYTKPTMGAKKALKVVRRQGQRDRPGRAELDVLRRRAAPEGQLEGGAAGRVHAEQAQLDAIAVEGPEDGAASGRDGLLEVLSAGHAIGACVEHAVPVEAKRRGRPGPVVGRLERAELAVAREEVDAPLLGGGPAPTARGVADGDGGDRREGGERLEGRWPARRLGLLCRRLRDGRRRGRRPLGGAIDQGA